MNYLRTYVRLIRKFQNQPEPETYEKHHVFPKSIYGKNNYVVKLTPRQHYIAHALLYKGLVKRYGPSDWRTKKMMHAFWFMHALGPRHNGRYTSARLYETIRVDFVKSLREQNMKKERNPFFGQKHSVLTRRKLSLMNGGTGQVDGLFEYFDEKFTKFLDREHPADWKRSKKKLKCKLGQLEDVLRSLSVAI
jgi:hypothetical protein